MTLTADDLARFEALLIERRKQLLGDFRSLEDGDAQNGTGSSAMASHIADLGSDQEASDISLHRRESESSEIQDIDDALDRVKDGSFGQCESCDKPINLERLEAIPYARLCMPCKIEEEGSP